MSGKNKIAISDIYMDMDCVLLHKISIMNFNSAKTVLTCETGKNTDLEY